MPPVTEIETLKVKADATPEDASSPAGQVMKQMIDLLAAQKGFQRAYWGRQIEDPSLLILAIDWDDLSDHHALLKNDAAISEFVRLGADVFDYAGTEPSIIHTNFASHPPVAPLEAPVTEVVYFGLPKAADDQTKSALEDAVLKLGETCVTSGPATAFATGWVVEDLDHEKGTDGKAIALNVIVGWPTKEAHIGFRGNADFLEAVGPVRSMVLPPTPGKSVYHVKFVKE